MNGYFSQAHLIIDDDSPIQYEMEIDNKELKITFTIKHEGEIVPHNTITLTFSPTKWQEFIHKGESLYQDSEIEGLLK